MTEEPRFRRYTPQVRAAMLVQAGLACLARGGITGFTIDNICREAKASRGLIAHHFGSKDGLLRAVHAEVYRNFVSVVLPNGFEGPDPELPELLAAAFSETLFRREPMNIWLALWSEISVNPVLRAEHRQYFTAYHDRIRSAIARHARRNGREVDADLLALPIVALMDGMWLEAQLDPDGLTPQRAHAAALALLEPALGPL